MRTIWKGAISFGLVHIPVKLYPATEQKDLKFNYLHAECHTPIKYEKKCPVCDREISMDEIIRGYEYEKGRYVILNEEDLDRLPVSGSKTVDILDFVQLTEIDPVYFVKSYYLAPGDGGQKAYALLREAMERSGKIAIAKVVIRTKQSLAAIRVYRHSLMMETMLWPDEIRSIADLPELNYQTPIHENELKMADMLINSLTEPFAAEKYHDEYRRALVELIEARIAGQEVALPERPEVGKVVDLMEALKASIRVAQEEKAGRGQQFPTPPVLPAASGNSWQQH